MAFTDEFRAQHDEILALAAGITELLHDRRPDAAALGAQLSVLAGQVHRHVALEEQALYPRLLGRRGTRAELVAGQFLNEMEHLAPVFARYAANWQAAAIQSDLAGFANDTRRVFSALAHRMSREACELFPLADQEE
jgi:hypothetical protein